MAEQYDAALRRRLGIVDSMGDSANQYAASIAQSRQAAAAQRQQQSVYQGMPQAGGNYATGQPGEFGRFLKAISGRESGGNYKARNRTSGALGKYQIMPGNVGPWSQEILGRRITPNQFYSSPKYQEQIAQGMLRKYYNQYGPEGAAVAWYAGPGTAKKYLRSGGKGYGRAQGNYSSISAYALGILKKMGLR